MAKTKQFAKIPTEIFTSGVSHLAVRVYLILQKYSYGKETAFPSQRTIATELRVHPRNVRKAAKELVEGNFIAIKPGLGRRSTTYTLFFNRRVVCPSGPLREGILPAHSVHTALSERASAEAAINTKNISTNNELTRVSTLIENDSEAATAATEQENGYMSLRVENDMEAGMRFWLRQRQEPEARYISRVEFTDGVLAIKSLKQLDGVPAGWLDFIKLRYPEVAEMRLI